jgi:2Fe-2S ferredoxin
MALITYIEFNGTAHQIDVEPGMTVMQGAVYQDVPGIEASCGGACACATCHIYVDLAWIAIVGDPNQQEAEMLDFAEHRQATSRLSCQIAVSEALDGMVVRMPETQG